MPSLLSVNVGKPRNVAWQGRTVYTGVWKDSVQGPRMVRRLNINGDGQGDLAGHGGEHRAVFVYQIDSYHYWQRQLGRDDFTHGQFGENFTVEGLSDQDVWQPDVGYLTATEMTERVAALCDIIDLPLIADGDTGYGNPLNVRRMVRDYERAGAAAVHIEDQTFPKRCGHMLGRDVIPVGEMVQKIKAAVDARHDPDFVIIARTDARTTKGLDEALQRGVAYHEAGADVLFIESPESEQEMRRICTVFRGTVPVLSNQIEGGRTPMPGVQTLEEMGYALAIFSLGTAFAAAGRMKNYLEALATEGDTRGALQRMVLFDDFNKLIGLDAHAEFEKRYET